MNVKTGAAQVKPAIKSPSAPSLPTFEHAPSCAECSDNLRYELQRKDALRTRYRLKKEERQRLDLHGLAGDVRGFLAFMTHRYGSFSRGWRKDVAPDEVGVGPVLQSDFFHAMRNIGYTGQLLSLWKELTREKESCWLADLDQKLSRGLDQLASGMYKVYRRGTQQAWEDIPKAWMTRMNFEEFLTWMNDQAVSRSRGFAVSSRTLFDVLDIQGSGTVTLKEFRFLDHWAHKRLKKPLPPEEVPLPPPPPLSPKSEPRSPAKTTKSPRKRGIKDFRVYLERLFGGPGGAGRAWRTALDVKGMGAVSVGDFGSGCRAVGWQHDHVEMWKLLKTAGGGLVKLRALDPQTAEAIDEFKDEACSRSRGVMDFWSEVMDPGGVGAVSRTEFLKDAGRALRLPRETLIRVFNVLDTTATGWVSEGEFTYLETFETKLAEVMADEKAKEKQKAHGYQTSPRSSMPELSGSSKVAKLQLPPGALGAFRLPWQAPERRAPLSAAELAASPLGRQLWAPHRSSRSFQYRALQTSHTLKHRFLSTAIEDRSICTNFDAVETMRSTHSQLFKTKSKDFIFRTSHEFYRKGMKKYLGVEDEDEEDH
mmetsp:Transcript_10837/g.25950  ORF Transcript_10837/g.25950 Transcript_10837/m.25950 type:complete len:593 (+) Transcript_10837:1-1779(+)